MQKIGVGKNFGQGIGQLGANRNLFFLLQLRVKNAKDRADDIIYLRRLALGLGHLREFAEPADDCFQIVDF